MFAKTGAAGIMIADINIETARNVAAKCKNVGMNSSLRVDAVYMDITDEASVDAALSHIGSAFGTIDHCVVTAGVRIMPTKRTATNSMENIAGLDWLIIITDARWV